MKHILIILSTYIIFGFILSFGGCVKITKVENINQQVRPLNTTIKRIIFHPKFITSPDDSLQLRKHFIDSLTSSLKNLKQYEVILLKSQESLPKLTDNKGGLLVKGHIWSHQSQQRGLNTSIKKLSQRTINYSRSWDVLENKKGGVMLEGVYEDGSKYFVGLSAVFSTEQSARDNALENATDRVVKYLGTFAKGKSLRMAKNFGLKSEKIDETLGGRAFQEQIYGSVARQVEAKKTYCDQNVWKCFVLARVPTTVLDDALKNAHENAEKDARKRSKDANTSAAKEQALNEAEFHAQMKKDGFLD